MNSPYRVHPALLLPDAPSPPFPKPTVVARSEMKPQPNRLALLVKLEGEIRQQPTWQATVFHALNEPQEILGHRQAFFFRCNNRRTLSCEGASAVAGVEARAPFITALNTLVNQISEPAKPLRFDLRQALKSTAPAHPHALWLPLLDGQQKLFGGFLLTRDDAWTDDFQTVAQRLAEAYGHGLRVHRPPQLLRRLSLPRWALYGVPLVLAALMLIPVPLTTLAPFEVVPRDPNPVTAPLEGVVKQIFVDPNTPVKTGDVLFALDSTELLSAAEVASQRVSVAQSKLATARNGAFGDLEMKRALSALESELLLAQSELDMAESRLQRAKVVAQAPGLLIYTSRNDWLGKPVRVGERVMDIADVKHVGVRVDVGVHDAVALDGDGGMRLFFDADPLNPRRAMAYEKSYHATERTSGQLTYTVRADFTGDDGDTPRIGLRGTAQLIGHRVPLGFYLFRRPIAALRQYLGL